MPIFVSGMLRSGSTVTCRILAQHDDVSNICCTSPTPDVLNDFIKSINSNGFFKAMPMSADDKNTRLMGMYKSIIDNWNDSDLTTIDKNRGWTMQIPLLKQIYPDFKMIICLRPLKDIVGSIINRNDKTQMLVFGGDMGTMSHTQIAEKALDNHGMIGSLLPPIWTLINEYMDRFDLSSNIYFQTPNSLLDTAKLFDFVGLDAPEFREMSEVVTDDDAMYNHKFPHTTKPVLSGMPEYEVSDHVASIIDQYKWYNYFVETIQPKKLKVV